MTTEIEQARNIAAVRGTRVRFTDCDTGRERFGVILDYCAPLCWHIQPDRGQDTYADDRTVTTLDGRRMADLV